MQMDNNFCSATPASNVSRSPTSKMLVDDRELLLPNATPEPPCSNRVAGAPGPVYAPYPSPCISKIFYQRPIARQKASMDAISSWIKPRCQRAYDICETCSVRPSCAKDVENIFRHSMLTRHSAHTACAAVSARTTSVCRRATWSPSTNTSKSVATKVLIASSGVQTIGSPAALKDVLSSTGNPER